MTGGNLRPSGRSGSQWRITNPNRPNGLGDPVAYRLVPQGDNVLPFNQPDSQVDGLPAWTAADRPLQNTDLVLWHTFTAHHVVRPEDWPVMPVTTVGFKLRADGFFDGNPALDLPPAEHWGPSCLAERVGDPDAAVVLAVAEILGQDVRTADGAGCLDDRGVPV